MLTDRIKDAVQSLSNRISDQVWVQQIKSKWEEIDPQHRVYYQYGATLITIFTALYFMISTVMEIYQLRTDYENKREALTLIRGAGDEVKDLQRIAAESSDWASYFQSLATEHGLDAAGIKVGEEKAPTLNEKADAKATPAAAAVEEMIVEINLPQTTIKKIIQYALAIENGNRPAKIRSLLIDKKDNFTGPLDSTLVVSAFKVK